MKIKTRRKSYHEVMALPKTPHRKPEKAWPVFPALIRLLSIPELLFTRFSYTEQDMEKAGDGPYLILMNHCCFTDLMIAFRMLKKIPFNIVCTTDAMVGKGWLMRAIGCFPTEKFVSDLTLVRDMMYVTGKLKRSVLMYPEAGYSFDGTSTTLPESLGHIIGKLGLPVLTIITEGAFARDPLYNGLQKRRVKISAKLSCLLSREEAASLSGDEINARIAETFSFDAFAWQRDNGIIIKEKFRADGLERVLYKCPHCGAENQMLGKGIMLTCKACSKQWEMQTNGQLRALDGDTEYAHIPDWFRWQRQTVREEILSGSYRMQTDVDIAMLVNQNALYEVGSGVLTHDESGFHLIGCDGALDYRQNALANYTLNSDFYWYEKADIMGIGRRGEMYYCFTKINGLVTKARLATEELYKIKKVAK